MTNATLAFVPSPQQAAFLNWCLNGMGSCVLEAVAGAGKTTTLMEAVVRLPGQIAMMMYNKKNAEEAKAKLALRGIDWKKCQAGTVHSFGMSAYRKVYPGVAVEGSKVSDIVDDMIPDNAYLGESKKAICKIVSMAKQTGLGVLRDANSRDNWVGIVDHYDIDLGLDELPPHEADALYDAILRKSYEVLSASNKKLDVIDFDDMCYLPLLLGFRFWQFDTVMIDEAQDTNATRREMARRMLKPRGRLIAVGDRHQAIYGFTGADNDSLDLIRNDFRAVDMPLTVTYRCPKAVVAFARQWVSHIEAHESAPEGVVDSFSHEEFMKEAPNMPELQVSTAVLCRNVKPLVSMAMQLIKRKVPCKIEGRDIAEQLKKLVKKWKITTTSQLQDRLETYREREIAKFRKRKQEAKVQVVEDTVDCLLTVIVECNEQGKNRVEDVVAYLDDLFSDNVAGILTLSSIHKSKGREWKTVYWLDRAGTCPSKYATLPWMQEQEKNLMYVAATRAMESLIELKVS